MIRPRRDLAIALVLLCISIPVFLNGLPGILRNDASWAVGLAVIAALVGFFSLFLSWNFFNALRIAQRLERGEGIVARWTVSSDVMAAFRRDETSRARNHWRPRNDTSVEILVGEEHVLVGGAIYSAPTSGLQRVYAVRILRSDPLAIEFDTSTMTSTGSPSARSIGFARGALRIPVTDRSSASKVLQHYQEMLLGRVVVAPKRWLYRIRGGAIGFVLAVVAGLMGYVLAEANGWRADKPLWWIPLVLLITAPLLALGSAIVMLAAWRFRQQQRGQR